MALSQGPASGLPGMTLKAWGLVNTATNSIIKGQNIASVVGNTVNLTTPLASTGAAIKILYMGNLDVTCTAFANTTSALLIGLFRVSTGGTPQTGLIYIEVYE